MKIVPGILSSIFRIILIVGFIGIPSSKAYGNDALIIRLSSQNSTINSANITMIQGTVTPDNLVQKKIEMVLNESIGVLNGCQYFAITSIYEEKNWLFISIAGFTKIGPLQQWSLDQAGWFGVMIVERIDGIISSGAIEGTIEYSELIKNLPENILGENEKENLDPLSPTRTLPTFTVRFPWQAGKKMQYGIKGVHSGDFNGYYGGTIGRAVDFISDGDISSGHAPNRLLAAISGTIGAVCNDQTSVAIKIGDFIFAHLLNNDNLHTNYSFNQGDEIGQLKPGSFGKQGIGCGYATQDENHFHVHMRFPNTGSFNIEGWTINWDVNADPYAWLNVPWQRDSNNINRLEWLYAEGSETIPCPISGDVILYQHYSGQYPNSCGNEGENVGYFIRNGAGFTNLPGSFNDKASSIKIKSGWSVKLYEKADYNGYGGWACRYGDDGNFYGEKFNNIVGLNDQVSSIQVYDSLNCGENHAPYTPSPQSPSDWSVSTDGRAPTLCWNNPGDPDGDSLLYYAEVYGSAINPNSGWRSDRCWRPDTLDGKYYTYQWRIKARDTFGAESGWNPTPWHFSIQPPNYPPSIDFRTANGNSFSSGAINSKDQNWTFVGTASDPENQLNRIEWRCSGDNCGNLSSHSGTGSWSHTQSGISGQNDIYFVAYDNYGNSTSSRHLDLRIDQAAPSTSISLNNEANQSNWPTWFTSVIQVKLRSEDGSTGRARSGVSQVRYQLDGGGWQSINGSEVNFEMVSDGTHTINYYSIDNVGNQENQKSIQFKIDRTPPSPPSGIVETHGVINNQWQNMQNTPTFTWAVSFDNLSGLFAYQFYFGLDPAGNQLSDLPVNRYSKLDSPTERGAYRCILFTRPDQRYRWKLEFMD